MLSSSKMLTLPRNQLLPLLPSARTLGWSFQTFLVSKKLNLKFFQRLSLTLMKEGREWWPISWCWDSWDGWQKKGQYWFLPHCHCPAPLFAALKRRCGSQKKSTRFALRLYNPVGFLHPTSGPALIGVKVDGKVINALLGFSSGWHHLKVSQWIFHSCCNCSAATRSTTWENKTCLVSTGAESIRIWSCWMIQSFLLLPFNLSLPKLSHL